MKKSLVLIGTLPLLAACHSAMTQPKPTTITSLSGKIQNWTAGAGTLELHSINAASSDGVIGTGSIAADGTVSGSLPTASQVGGYLHPVSQLGKVSSNCTSTVKASGSANVAAISGFTATVNGKVVDQVIPGGLSTSNGVQIQQSGQTLFYADQAVNVSGQQSCPESVGGQTVNLNYTLNLNLASGWNVVNVQSTGTLTNSTFTLTTTDKLAANWATASSLATMSVSPSKLNLFQNFLR